MLSQAEITGQPGGGHHPNDSRLMRLLMQAPGLFAFFKQREGFIELANTAFIQLFGNAILPNLPMRDALPELQGRNFFENIELAFDTGQPVHTYKQKLRAGTHENDIAGHYFDLAYTPSFNEYGKVEGVILTGHDVSAQISEMRQLAEQSKLFKDMVDASGTALWTVDLYGGITYVNQTWIDWTGQPYEAHLGRGWSDFVVPEDRERVISSYIRYFYRRKEYDVDFRVLRSDGHIQWVAANGKPRYLSTGEFVGYVGSCMDITERKLTEQQLIDSEERFRNIADSAPVLIWMTGRDKATTFLNKCWSQFSPMESIPEGGEYLQSHLIHEHDTERVLEAYHQAYNHHEEFYEEYRMLCTDGSYRWIGMKGVPRVASDGVFEGYIGSGMDITAMKEHEIVKNDFIGMASHELKTPITSIKAYIQLLLNIYKNKPDDAFLMKSLTTVNSQINKLTRLITDLLDVSKMESGRLSLNHDEFVLNDVVQDTVEEVQHTTTSHEIIFTADTTCSVYADRDRIAQVVTNFLTNAIKYSPHDDRVNINLKVENGHAIVAVQDYGIGISPAEQHKVFNRFYRVEGRNEQTFSGFGIGLYVAAEIVRRHNGRVWVESEKDKGSVFHFSMPVR